MLRRGNFSGLNELYHYFDSEIGTDVRTGLQVAEEAISNGKINKYYLERTREVASQFGNVNAIDEAAIRGYEIQIARSRKSQTSNSYDQREALRRQKHFSEIERNYRDEIDKIEARLRPVKESVQPIPALALVAQESYAHREGGIDELLGLYPGPEYRELQPAL